MRTAIFLQVRIDSSRLPGKALLSLPGGNVIQHAMRGLKQVPADVYALLTDEDSLPVLREWAGKEGFEIFSGPKDDVLTRFLLAARHFDVRTLVRATGDNPLVSPRLGRGIMAIHREMRGDLSHFLNIPIGSGIEVVEREALEKAAARAVDPFEREHLTTHMYRHRKDFQVLEIPCAHEVCWPDLKISLDTQEDYRFIRDIYMALYRGEPLETEEVIRWLRREGGMGREEHTVYPRKQTG